MGDDSGTRKVPSLPPPLPKSPPEYPDLYGKRRESARVQMLEREIGFLEDELKFVEGLQPASQPCKEVTEFVMATSDPFMPTTKRAPKSCRFWKWLCGYPCLNFSWICCCCCCTPHLELPSCCNCNTSRSTSCMNCCPKPKSCICGSSSQDSRSQCCNMNPFSLNCCPPECPLPSCSSCRCNGCVPCNHHKYPKLCCSRNSCCQCYICY